MLCTSSRPKKWQIFPLTLVPVEYLPEMKNPEIKRDILLLQAVERKMALQSEDKCHIQIQQHCESIVQHAQVV